MVTDGYSLLSNVIHVYGWLLIVIHHWICIVTDGY